MTINGWKVRSGSCAVVLVCPGRSRTVSAVELHDGLYPSHVRTTTIAAVLFSTCWLIEWPGLTPLVQTSVPEGRSAATAIPTTLSAFQGTQEFLPTGEFDPEANGSLAGA